MGRPGWLARTWADTSTALRTSCLVLWTAAAATTVLGVLGDARGWWVDRPFLNNLASSLATALFGIPVALIVVQRITAAEANRRQRQEVTRFARATIESLRDDLRALALDRQLLPALVTRLRRMTDELLPALPHRHYGPELERVLRGWQEVYELWPRVLVDQAQAATVLRAAGSHWRFFRDHVAPTLRQHDVGWLSPAETEAVSRLLAATSVHYRGCGEPDAALATAAEAALAVHGMAPLARLYGGNDDAVLTGIEQHVDDVALCVWTAAELLGTVEALATRTGATR